MPSDEYIEETEKVIHWLRMMAGYGEVNRLQKYNLEFAAERLDDLLSFAQQKADG